MLHEFMVAQQLELQQKRIDWVNKNAWKFQANKKPVKKVTFQTSKQPSACCA